ncbi:hypothetical protein LY76DRAFT_379804 [Colletotrichum caudatum]|nr:hypothetical protein LY76DRAFT_379804 [Colletotrichum caudatum]
MREGGVRASKRSLSFLPLPSLPPSLVCTLLCRTMYTYGLSPNPVHFPMPARHPPHASAFFNAGMPWLPPRFCPVPPLPLQRGPLVAAVCGLTIHGISSLVIAPSLRTPVHGTVYVSCRHYCCSS